MQEYNLTPQPEYPKNQPIAGGGSSPSDTGTTPASVDHETSLLGDELITENRALIEKACSARFMREVRANSISTRHFSQYLLFESRFVMAAARLLAAAVQLAPDDSALINHAGALHDLVTEQRGYFRRAFEKLGEPRPPSPDAVAAAESLDQVARRVRERMRYTEIMVISYATEHLYLTWCTEAQRYVDPHQDSGVWVLMHTADAFVNRVRWLKDEIDSWTPASVNHVELSRLFAATIAAEIEFHESPYL